MTPRLVNEEIRIIRRYATTLDEHDQSMSHPTGRHVLDSVASLETNNIEPTLAHETPIHQWRHRSTISDKDRYFIDLDRQHATKLDELQRLAKRITKLPYGPTPKATLPTSWILEQMLDYGTAKEFPTTSVIFMTSICQELAALLLADAYVIAKKSRRSMIYPCDVVLGIFAYRPVQFGKSLIRIASTSLPTHALTPYLHRDLLTAIADDYCADKTTDSVMLNSCPCEEMISDSSLYSSTLDSSVAVAEERRTDIVDELFQIMLFCTPCKSIGKDCLLLLQEIILDIVSHSLTVTHGISTKSFSKYLVDNFHYKFSYRLVSQGMMAVAQYKNVHAWTSLLWHLENKTRRKRLAQQRQDVEMEAPSPKRICPATC